MVRRRGFPRLSKEYLITLIQLEQFFCMLYSVSIGLSVKIPSFTVYFPLALYYWVGCCEFLNRLRTVPLFNSASLQKVVQFTRKNKDTIIKGKLKVEMLYIFYFLSLWMISGRISPFTIITHIFYL